MTTENQNEEPSQERPDQRSLSIGGSVDNSPIVVGDRNTINQGPTSYYTTNVFSPVNVAPATSAPSQPLSKQEYRWRQVLVDNVKHYWIEGVLEKSLHNQALIELGLEERSKAVTSPVSGVGEFPDEPSRVLPEGTKATDIFDGLGAGRTLLILGEPGAGKTTTLLKLAQSLLERIGDDLSQPIPVILNLSSWAKKRQPIAEWLVQDLYETFQVSKALGKIWIAEEQLVLCLDGLDEVEAKHRNACVEALNQFIQEHGRTEMVVCSRIKDYEALSERLRLRSAIYVQPLTTEQVDHYLMQAGEQLAALRTVLNQNAEIKEFARSPLILSVMSFAYQDDSSASFPDVGSAETFQQRLFDTYIKRMFQRRRTMCPYESEAAKHWLVWIAQRMVSASQTVFFIENIQPSWLQTKTQRLWYRLESSLILGLVYGLSYGLIYGLSYGLISELSYLPAMDSSYGLNTGLRTGLLGGLANGVGAGLVATNLGNIAPVETLRWSWRNAKKNFLHGLVIGSLLGLIGGLIIGLIVGLVEEGLITGVGYMLGSGLLVAVTGGLCGGLTSGLIGGLKGPGMHNKMRPNQGIWKSARNAGIFTLIIGLSAGFIGGQSVGLLAVLSFGLMAGMIGGGSACLRHLSLRLMLYRLEYVPWNYARFLDYATERLFLQKVGGGYIFIHRMLLEHFAQMELGGKL